MSSSKANQRRSRVKKRQRAARAATAAITRPLKEKGPSGLVKRAMEAWKNGQYDRSIQLFERAHRLNPNRVEILLDLGRAYGMRYRYEDADACFAQALRLSPNNAKTFRVLGENFRSLARFPQASDYFARAVAHQPRDTAALISLAEVSERLHRLDDAREAIERALALEPEHPTGLYLQAKLERRAGDPERAETLLRDLLSQPTKLLEPRWRSWYELASILDKQQRFEEAMQALEKAKQVLRRSGKKVSSGADLIGENNRAMLEALTKRHLEKWWEARESLQPAQRLALLCGHPRSGTTLIEQVLDSHPELVSADETNIMSDDVYIALGNELPEVENPAERLDAASVDQLLGVRADYLCYAEAFLGQALNGRMLLDKNPELTMILPVIARVFPEIKILCALRDPRDVCLSCFMQPLPMNAVSVHYLSIESTVAKYASTMQTWLTLRPLLSSDWMETRYEDNVADLEAESRKILDFLGLEWDAKVLHYHEHASEKHVRSPTYEAVTKPVYKTSVQRWRNYEKWLGPYLDQLDPFLRAFGYD